MTLGRRRALSGAPLSLHQVSSRLRVREWRVRQQTGRCLIWRMTLNLLECGRQAKMLSHEAGGRNGLVGVLPSRAAARRKIKITIGCVCVTFISFTGLGTLYLFAGIYAFATSRNHGHSRRPSWRIKVLAEREHYRGQEGTNKSQTYPSAWLGEEKSDPFQIGA
ncbi:hypothetical protein EI94DRAFT_328709 [Lactarius quietus]|nr:hypothetical protein EI94DRAFT_328709 [Lactarius quietus]